MLIHSNESEHGTRLTARCRDVDPKPAAQCGSQVTSKQKSEVVICSYKVPCYSRITRKAVSLVLAVQRSAIHGT